MRPSLKLTALGVCLLWLLAGRALADPFVGRFSGEINGEINELLIYSGNPGSYDGELRARGERLPVFGRRFGDRLVGKIGFPDNEFAFRARVMGAVLILERRSGPPLRFWRQSD